MTKYILVGKYVVMFIILTGFGILYDKYKLHNTQIDTKNDYKLMAVNAVGEGQINVVKENGNIAKGDLIVCSSTAGKGMKQTGEAVKSFTVARARSAVTWASSETDVRLVPCIYLCG